mmetsp:Transcript_61438/g.144571  ORF Transcript_61438/g.144571 Transcript_61438/m.144571 type:complete len:378 (+) Transcript_61438:465-1598(+)
MRALLFHRECGHFGVLLGPRPQDRLPDLSHEVHLPDTLGRLEQVRDRQLRRDCLVYAEAGVHEGRRVLGRHGLRRARRVREKSIVLDSRAQHCEHRRRVLARLRRHSLGVHVTRQVVEVLPVRRAGRREQAYRQWLLGVVELEEREVLGHVEALHRVRDGRRGAQQLHPALVGAGRVVCYRGDVHENLDGPPGHLLEVCRRAVDVGQLPVATERLLIAELAVEQRAQRRELGGPETVVVAEQAGLVEEGIPRGAELGQKHVVHVLRAGPRLVAHEQRVQVARTDVGGRVRRQHHGASRGRLLEGGADVALLEGARPLRGLEGLRDGALDAFKGLAGGEGGEGVREVRGYDWGRSGRRLCRRHGLCAELGVPTGDAVI